MKLTEKSFEVLKSRLQEAMDADKDIVIEIEEARKLGDLSENADYSAAMDKKRSNDALIADLRAQIDSAEVVGDPVDTSKVSINSIVHVVRIKDKAEKTYQIGDSVSADPEKGIISEKSPLGKALTGHGVGETVSVEVAHPFLIKIVKIEAVK